MLTVPPISPDISKTLLRFLQDIIVSLVEESDKMPEGVLDCLLGQVKGNKNVRLTSPLAKHEADPVTASRTSGIHACNGRDDRSCSGVSPAAAGRE